MSKRAAMEPRVILRAFVKVLVVLGVLAMHHLSASVADDSMAMDAANTSSHAVVGAEPLVTHRAANITLVEAPATPLLDMGGCEGAMLLCGAMVALVVAAVTRTRRRDSSFLTTARVGFGFGLPHRWVMYLRTPVIVPRARVVCRC